MSFTIEQLNEQILECYHRLLIARAVMSNSDDIEFSLGGHGICKYSGQHRVDGETEGLLLRWLESARAENEKIKAHLISVAGQLDDKIGAEMFLVSQPMSIIDIADKYGMSIEETVACMMSSERAACELAYHIQ